MVVGWQFGKGGRVVRWHNGKGEKVDGWQVGRFLILFEDGGGSMSSRFYLFVSDVNQ